MIILSEFKNTYDAMKRILDIDEELQQLGKELTKTKNITDKERINHRIEVLDGEFLVIVHSLKEIPYVEKR